MKGTNNKLHFYFVPYFKFANNAVRIAVFGSLRWLTVDLGTEVSHLIVFQIIILLFEQSNICDFVEYSYIMNVSKNIKSVFLRNKSLKSSPFRD